MNKKGNQVFHILVFRNGHITFAFENVCLIFLKVELKMTCKEQKCQEREIRQQGFATISTKFTGIHYRY